MIIGYIPKTVRSVPALLVASNMSNEGIHINLNLKNQVIERYSVTNGTKSSIDGMPGDGTSIDYDEPFVLNLSCDQDGWILQINNEPSYLTVLHDVPVDNLTEIRVTGDIVVNYIGIGDKGKQYPIKNVYTSVHTALVETGNTGFYLQGGGVAVLIPPPHYITDDFISMHCSAIIDFLF